ncbi:MAG: hypothetical protein ABR555_05615 [Pyrinomonadaceae bacterium]
MDQESTSRRISSSTDLFPRSWLLMLYLATLLATAIVIPMLFLGNASGHDFQQHLASWIETSGQWRQGIIFPRWAAGANYTFGEPRFIFYPPASWLLGGALGSILSWRAVPGAYVWLMIVVACMAMWKLARDWLSPGLATVASLLFGANPYFLTLVYYRSDFAELLVGALLPLLLWPTLRLLQCEWRRAPMLSLVFAGIWLSNAPAAVIATYSLTLVLVIATALRRELRILITGGLSMVAGFAVAAFYLIPAWWEQRWVRIGQAVSNTYNPENNFLFTRSNDPEFIQFNWKISTVAVVLIALTAAGIAWSRTSSNKSRELWWIMVALSGASVVLMLPPSAFLWRRLPELRFLQFPWRWLLLLSLPFAFFSAAAGHSRTWRVVIWTTLICVIFATGTAIAGDTAWDSEDTQKLVADIGAGRGYEGIEGFEPRGSSPDELDDTVPLIAEFDAASGDINEPEESNITLRQWAAENKSFDVKSNEPVTLVLRLLNYPAWEVEVDNKIVTTGTAPQTGQILLQLPGGSHRVDLQFRVTGDRFIGMVISSISIVLLIVVLVLLNGFRRWISPPSRNPRQAAL